MATQLGHGHRSGPADVAGLVLGARAHVEHDHLASAQTRRQLAAVDDLDTVTLAEVGGGQPVEACDVVRSGVPQG